MYLCAKSILHLLEIDEPKIILAYIVYNENQVTYEEYSVTYENRDSYIESKLPIGIKSELLESWRKEEIILPLGMKAKVIKAMRNAHGNYNFGWV